MTAAIAAITAHTGAAPVDPPSLIAQAPPLSRGGFSVLLAQGIETVETRAKEADELARAFIVDDSIPVHQVTFALEQARLSMELMIQVRNHLVAGYQQIMTMQL